MGRARDRASADLNGQEFILDADADTSISADTDDQIDIRVAGSDQIKIAAGEVAFNEASGDIDFRVKSNNDANKFVVDGGNDQVLFGTTASRVMYGVTPSTFIEGLDYNTSSLGIVTNRNDGAGGFLFFGKSKGTSLGSSTSVSSGDDLGSIVWTAADGTDMNSVSAMITGGIDTTPGSNDVPGNIKFSTASDGASNASVRMKINSSGDLHILDGDIVFEGSGNGINLGVTSNTDSNTLDDYEEGTWTLDPKGSTTAGSYSASAMSGHYTKIGRIVHVEYRITAGTISSAAGSFQIHGLPFAVGGVGYPTGSVSFFNVDFNPDRRQDANGSASYIYFLVSVDNGTWTSIQTSAMSSSHYVHGSLTYAVS